MPVRLPPITDAAGRVLLDAIVDYAGLFPPAAHSLPIAVRNYAHYRASGDGWMLGRFVCPAGSLEEFSRAADVFLPRDAGAIPWRLAVTGSGNPEADRAAIAAFNERHRVCFDECGAIADVYETRVDSATAVGQVSGLFDEQMALYLEVPIASDPAELLDAIRAHGRRAKVRTGGVTTDAFPTAAALARFLQRCVERDVACKATAGLHHAVRGDHTLTYDADSPRARMFGFLNVFLAAALAAAAAPESDVVAMLEERDASTINGNDQQFVWHGPERVHVLDRVLLSQLRRNVLVSFGSCSFTEPVDESRQLGLL